MKQITGGDGPVLPGTRCVVYCCRLSDNVCNSTGIVLSMETTCSSNEQCQTIGIEEYEAECAPGRYVAALCKG